MIPNKAAFILFLITMIIKTSASTSSSDAQRSNSSNKLASIKSRRHATGVKKNVLHDTTYIAEVVQPIREITEVIAIPQERPVSQVNKELEEWVDHGKYKKISELGKKMSKGEFLKQLCLVIKTFEQFNEFAICLVKSGFVTFFYMYGDIKIVKEAIIVESLVYGKPCYDKAGDLEAALHLTFEAGNYTRFTDLLNARQEATAGKNERPKSEKSLTNFEEFLFCFLEDPAPWANGMIFKRFLTLHGDELRNKYPDILGALFYLLLFRQTFFFCTGWISKFLDNLIGQPSLLTSVSFVKRFLYHDCDGDRSDLIRYGWREAIDEGLKKEYAHGSEKLLRMIKDKYIWQFAGKFRSTADVLDTALANFPTKEELEERWGKKNVPDFSKQIDKLITYNILPKVLMRIVIDYAAIKPTWIDIPSIKS